MQATQQSIPGVYLIQATLHTDHRGLFVKTFQAAMFDAMGISFVAEEEFYSRSKKGVLRGMHFQRPPYDHAKLVFCVRGRVCDVLVDLRQRLPSYATVLSVELSERNPSMLYIPHGIAHGFLSLEDDSIMLYKTTRKHEPSHDAGIHWGSIGFDWGIEKPIVSLRDSNFPALRDYASPF